MGAENREKRAVMLSVAARTNAAGMAVPSGDVFDCRGLPNNFHEIIV
jgi:hypothetical protein